MENTFCFTILKSFNMKLLLNSLSLYLLTYFNILGRVSDPLSFEKDNKDKPRLSINWISCLTVSLKVIFIKLTSIVNLKNVPVMIYNSVWNDLFSFIQVPSEHWVFVILIVKNRRDVMNSYLELIGKPKFSPVFFYYNLK